MSAAQPTASGVSDADIARAVRPLYSDDAAAAMGLPDDIKTARAILALRPQAVPMNREPGDLPCGESASDSSMSNCLGMGLHVCNDCVHGITAPAGGEG